MMALTFEMRAVYAFIGRNFNLVKRYFAWEIVFLSYSVANTLTIAYIGYGDDEKTRYLIIGALLWSFLSVVFHAVSEAIAWERWEGTIEYTLMAPIRRVTHLMGQCVFALAYGMARTVIILVCVALFFNLRFTNADFGCAAVVLVVACFSFLGMGLAAAVLPLLSPERGAQATHIFQAVILLVSGVYYDVSVLPGWLRVFSHVSPATYTLRAMRKAMLEGAPISAVGWDLLILFGIGVVLLPVGLAVFALGERYARKTGKLKRSG